MQTRDKDYHVIVRFTQLRIEINGDGKDEIEMNETQRYGWDLNSQLMCSSFLSN